MDRYITGSNIHAARGAQALNDLRQTEAATKARERRARASRAPLQTGGALYARDARQMAKKVEVKAAKRIINSRKRRLTWKRYKSQSQKAIGVALRGRSKDKVQPLRITGFQSFGDNGEPSFKRRPLQPGEDVF